MDFGSLSRLPHPVGAATISSTNAQSREGAVATDLPRVKAVGTAEAGDAVRLDLRSPAPGKSGEAGSKASPEPPRRRHVIEPVTRTVVLERIDPDTGEAVMQVPDEAMLKLRILMRELSDRLRQDGRQDADDAPRTVRSI
jgi:hypothetical protein